MVFSSPLSSFMFMTRARFLAIIAFAGGCNDTDAGLVLKVFGMKLVTKAIFDC